MTGKASTDPFDCLPLVASLQASLDLANMGAWGWDEIAKAKHWPPQTKALFGLGPDVEVTRELFVSLLHPDDVERFEQAWAAAGDPAGERVYQLTYRIRRANDGSERLISSKARVEFEGGAMTRVVGALRDVTDERKALERLQENEQRFEVALGNSQIAVFEQDCDLRYTWIYNPKLGYVAHEVVGKTEAEVMDASCAPALETLKRRVMATGRPERQEMPMAAPGAPLEHYDLYVEPRRDKSGAIVGVICAAADVTGQKRAREELAAAIAEKNDILDSIDDGFYALDARGCFVYVNKRAREMMNVRSEDLIGRPYSEVFPQFQGHALQKAGQAVASDGNVRRLEMQGVRDGRWYSIAIYPRPQGGVSIYFRDIHASKQVELAMKESEQRYRAFFENAATGAVEVGPDGRFLKANRRFSEFIGYDEDRLRGMTALDLTHPDDRADQRAILDAFLRGDISNLEYDKRFVRSDGRVVWGRVAAALVRDAEGRPLHTVGVVTDIDDRKRSEAALRASELMNRAVLENSPDCVILLALDGRVLFMNANGQRDMQIDDIGAVLDAFCWEFWPKEAAGEIRDAVASAGAGAAARFQASRPTTGGEPRWWDVIISCAPGEDGRPRRLIAVARDITEQRRSSDRIALLMREVDHRSKNMLSLVYAIARQTAAKTPDDFMPRFESRIGALSAAQDLLLRREWGRLDLAELIRAQLAHFGDALDDRIVMTGPAAWIAAEAAQSLSMAFHELATNAGKYGALSGDVGEVSVAWSMQDGEIAITWGESGGPKVDPPQRAGFGTTVLTKMFEAQFKRAPVLEYRRDGLRWSVKIPVDAASGGARTDTVER